MPKNLRTTKRKVLSFHGGKRETESKRERQTGRERAKERKKKREKEKKCKRLTDRQSTQRERQTD